MPVIDLFHRGTSIAVEHGGLRLVELIQDARARHAGKRLSRPHGRNHHGGTGETESRHQKLPSFHFNLHYSVP